MTVDDVIVYGAGGFAREVAWLASECGANVRAFVDDDASRVGTRLNEIEVVSLEQARARFSQAKLAVAVGSPAVRRALVQKAAAAGFAFAELIHPRVERSRWIAFGEGSVICAGCILTTNIRFGNHVQVNLDCTVGHDVVMEDFVTLAPGVHVSGWVHIREGAYLGTGSVVINGTAEKPLVIGAAAVVGAGACVVKTVDPDATVVGVPAKPLTAR